MLRLNLFRSAVVLMAALLLPPASAPAQDTLSIVGTFKMSALQPTVGDELAAVFANGNDHWWKLTLHGASYSHDYTFSGDVEEFRTRVHAASFTFEFFGPDAAILNDVVGSHLTQGGVPEGAPNGAVLELVNAEDSYETYMTWVLRLYPSDPANGFYFVTSPFGWYQGQFPTDELGYPLVQPQRLSWADSLIWNKRDGNFVGYLQSFGDIMDIGSDQQPLPLPPPLTIAVADASAVEGNRGTTTMSMTVTLSRARDRAVTVNYQTFNGTATAGKDYEATSGALTFQPGETSKTIELSIKGDRQRERDETFFVRLSNAVGGMIGDSEGVATILNDD
jgi:hypothetical protein